jgi:hypothetical protein
VSTALVEDVDVERRCVRLAASMRDVERLPEHVPIAS